MSNRHVFLKNKISTNPTFSRKRGFSSNVKDSDQQEEWLEDKILDSNRIRQFRIYYNQFTSDRERRRDRRTIEFPSVIDLLEISFFKTLNNDLREIFLVKYGLDVLELKSFNRTAVFEVVDNDRFAVFEGHIKFIISHKEPVLYLGEDFNVLALMQSFRFLAKRNFSTQDEGVNIKLISSSNLVSQLQNEELIKYLNKLKLDLTVSSETPDIISISMISWDTKVFIEDNFDIVETITSSRALQVRPGLMGQVRMDYGFNVTVKDNLPTVGVIDTGISNISPYNNLLEQYSYDHTGQGAFNDPVGHGTLVAGLIIFGDEFPNTVQPTYIAKAKVVAIKALHRQNDSLNILKIVKDIREERRTNGTRIFNMSLNLVYSKKYNSSFSDFAYELDKLAFEEDLIIFLSVGNFDTHSLKDLIYNDLHPDHKYPEFFYKLDRTTPSHSCENTNICVPSDSLNNISVGALAGNLEPKDNSDISPSANHPAYYTRKFHLDFEQKVNGVPLGRNQKNKNINKPDFIYDGGDLLTYDAGMETLAVPGSWYVKSAGTSLATPLIASLAAQVIHQYPLFNMQSVKALLLNSASHFKNTVFPEFSTNKKLYKKLIGNGKPDKSKLFNSSNNSIVLVIEDKIKAGEIINMPIHLPEYIKSSGNKLKIDISLCYKFNPIHKDHLNYNPLHISFNVVKNLPISIFESGTAAEYGIKKSFSWSEDDFGLDNLLFSNSQYKSYTLQPNDLNNVAGTIRIAVRCLVKNKLNTIHSSIENEFSLVARLTEIGRNVNNNHLYDEIREINNVVDMELRTDTDLELEA